MNALAVGLTSVLVAAAVPAAAPTPFAIGTIEPDVRSAPAGYPNIGRVRTAAAACSAMRELVVPSLAAARKANETFSATRGHLSSYTALVADPEHRADVYRQVGLAKLDADATVLLHEAETISRALGDPRISRYARDPELLAQRSALQRIYDAQSMRANLLEEFVIRQRNVIATNGIDDSRVAQAASDPSRRAGEPDPAATVPPNMPKLSGIEMVDRQSIGEWAAAIASDVRASEAAAAKSLSALTTRCVPRENI